MRIFPTKTSMRNYFVPFARFSIALVYIWFGVLKILEASPAEPLVRSLEQITLPFIPFTLFYIGFAYFEVVIGLLFLIPRATKIACALLALHLGTTILPLLFLPTETWSDIMIPTLVGQYIIKNIVIIATAWGIYAHE